jgi:hypothetical protein
VVIAGEVRGRLHRKGVCLIEGRSSRNSSRLRCLLARGVGDGRRGH